MSTTVDPTPTIDPAAAAPAPTGPDDDAVSRALAGPDGPSRRVLNQAPPLHPVDLFATDVALREGLEREGGAWGVDRVAETGRAAGTVEARDHGLRAERNEPRLVTHDRYGTRVDEVELDPSWHWLLDGAIRRGLAGGPWRDDRPGAHVVRAAGFALWGHTNGGVMCPVSMTYAVVPALRDGAPALAAEWEDRLTRPDTATGAIAGMAMTERQGGSDVRANITVAVPAGGDEYELWGHKWFCSYPPCDVFLVLAQLRDAPDDPDGSGPGLSCFLVERGPGMEFQRLKDKLGTRSLPSSEVEFRGARGRLVGEPGGGVRAIIRMVNHTRLDCLIGSTTSMRRGTIEAIHHARHRSAFGASLVDQPAMQNVLADLAIESEAATAVALRMARAYDEDDAAFRRFGTAVMKYWVCKRAGGHANEALECLGGNGFVEESGMPLLYRDAPLMSIWEGSGNVAALDVLRALGKEPEGLPAFLRECALASGADPRFDAHLREVRARVEGLFAEDGRPVEQRLYDAQFVARRIVEDLGVLLQASLLLRHSTPAVADAFCAARLGGEAGRAYGTLPRGVDARAIVDRAFPA
ncbi:acyl-CoA dehydrogenase family protein [Patulibacter sp.]|uniref:acyl-CoA dehydrogenase family protein n=1 Tax=Patulibacter sp. TaxID=1912859 RepID=UPI00271BEC6C|nr:acyl-CoA dehydrogenase family protein [Patulibacter sp.]MDO9408251.1 acyl-CoA dehydrogenase family protein [Patulibacter sp.]